jgi:DNA-directed RNA polymerase subunit beta'
MDSKQPRRQGRASAGRAVDAKGKEVTFANTDIPAIYALPAGALVSLDDGAKVSAG